MGPRRVLDTKTYWLTDRQSQYDFDFDFDYGSVLTFEFSVEDSHGNFVDLWILNVWLEGFILV
jgi:hypothetical protein